MEGDEMPWCLVDSDRVTRFQRLHVCERWRASSRFHVFEMPRL